MYEPLREIVYRLIEPKLRISPKDFVNMPLSDQRLYVERITGRRLTIRGMTLEERRRYLSSSEIELNLAMAIGLKLPRILQSIFQ